jgi:hypothetical protein
MSDGTKEFVGTWRCGGTSGTRVDFPYANQYFVKVVNKRETRVFWFEH